MDGDLDVVEKAERKLDLLALTAQIVSAHVSNNQVKGADLPGVILTVHGALKDLGSVQSAAPPVEAAALPTPAVPIKKSVYPDYIVCLEDGKKMKMLKRHLQASYGMTPDQYRNRWGLPRDYPMVAPSYAERRSVLAREIGLGRKSSDQEPANDAESKPRGRGRSRAG